MPATQFANPANNVASTLTNSVDAVTTFMPLIIGGGNSFPVAPFYCSCEFEVMLCTLKTGDTLTVTRGVDGTTAAAHPASAVVEIRNNAAYWKDAYTAINTNAADVDNYKTQVTNKTALPPDTTYKDNTQELTHKTIDLSDPSKQNVIIGTVQPDPASLPLQNILINGGFEEWTFVPSLTLAAGTPASGQRTGWFANGWQASGVNDSSITVTRDTANPDPTSQSGTNLLLNITTVQGNDWVYIQQFQDSQNSSGSISVDIGDIKKIIGAALSVAARIKLISGSNVTVRFAYSYYDGSWHTTNGPTLTVSGSTYSTYKFENQVILPNANTTGFVLLLQFQGVGQVAVDNIMLNAGTTAVGYRPRYAQKPVIVQNFLTNGGFEVWQRGGGPFTGNNTYIADKWQILLAGNDTISVSKDGSNNENNASQFCAACTVTVGTGAGGSGIYQSLTLADGHKLWNQIVTFSMRVRTSTANAVRIAAYNGSTWSYSAFHSGNGVYQTLSITTVIPAGGTLFNVAAYFSLSCTAYLDNAIYVIGAIPADYAPMHPADELARCLRYYERWNDQASGNSDIGWQGQVTVNNEAHFGLRYFVPKGGTPTITPIGSVNLLNATYGGSQASTVFQSVTAGSQGARIRIVVSGTSLVPGNVTTLQGGAGSYIVSEWNP